MADQPGAPELSVEDRLANIFGGNVKAAPSPQPSAEDRQEVAPADAEQQPAPYQEAQEQEAADGQEEAQEPTNPDFEEIDWEDGRRYQIPTALKPALMKEADYRRKTMELAEVRKATEADRFRVQSTLAFQQQAQPLMNKRAELASVKERAKTLDWTSLSTDQKIDVDRELRNIDEQINQIDSQIVNGYRQHEQAIGGAVLQAVSSTEQYMTQRVPQWSQQTGQLLHDYGLQSGIPRDKLITAWFADPVATHVMWKAQQWDKLQAGKPQVQNRAANAPPVIKPNSNATQQSAQSAKFRESRERLRKTGSLEDAAAVFFQRMK